MKKYAIIILIVLLLATSYFSGCIQDGTGLLVLQITDVPAELNISEALVRMLACGSG